MTSGIYTIVHRESGRCYVGSSNDVEHRWYQHRWHLNRGTHSNKRLQRAWIRDGADAFEWNVIESCEIDLLIEREQCHLDQRRPHVYNIGQFVEAVTRGMPVPESVRRKISESHKARGGLTPEHLAKLSAANKRRAGWKHTEEAKAISSATNKGRKRTPEHREAIRLAQMGNQHRVGKKMPPGLMERLLAGRRAYLLRKATVAFYA